MSELAPDATPENALKALEDLFGIAGIPRRSLDLIHTMFRRYQYAIDHPNPRYPNGNPENGLPMNPNDETGHTTDHRTPHDTKRQPTLCRPHPRRSFANGCKRPLP